MDIQMLHAIGIMAAILASVIGVMVYVVKAAGGWGELTAKVENESDQRSKDVGRLDKELDLIKLQLSNTVSRPELMDYMKGMNHRLEQINQNVMNLHK